MRASLIINSHELGDYIVEGGIAVTKEERVSKSITTMDGTKWETTVYKMNISVTLSDLFDDVYTTVAGYFTPNPAVVSYSNFETGQTYSGTFYIKDIGHTVTKSIGTLTYLQSLSFKLEEK